MMKFLQVPKYFFRIVCFFVALIIVSITVIYFGLPILGPGLPGSDNSNFVTLADWLYRWFPNIPFWYPQQGAGVSFTTFYPILNHLIVVTIAKLFAVPVLVSFRYYALISVILTSIGIYFLAVRFTKNQIIALLASIFYPLSSIAWIFLLGWGFFAEQASYVFVPPAIVFFEIYLAGVYENKSTLANRLSLLLFMIFSVLSLLGHPLAFIGLIVLLVPFFIIYPLFSKRKSGEIFKKSILVGLFSFGLIIVLSLFTLVPFFRYQNIVSQQAATGKMGYSRGLMLQNYIYPKTFFNISPEPVIYKSLEDKIEDRSADGWRNVAFPIAISIFAFIGFVGSFFLNRRLFALALANFFPLVLALSPEILFFLFKTPVLNYFANWRALLIPSRFVIPILAAFGCYAIAYYAASPIKFLFLKSKGRGLRVFSSSLFVLVTSILTVVVAVFGIYYFKNWPRNPNYLISYGPETYYPGFKADLRNIWGKEIDFCNAYAGWAADKIPVFCSNKGITEAFWYKKVENACGEIEKDEITAGSEIKKLCSGNISREEINKILDNCQKPSLSSDMNYVCQARVKTVSEQIASENLTTKLQITNIGKQLIVGDEKKLIEKLPNDPNNRVDISPGLGSILMGLPYYRDIPELGVYYNQSSLIPLMWNYQMTAFYSQSGIWSQPQITNELSKYFGIGYSLISETNVPIEKFEKNWEQLDQNPNIFGVLGLWRNKQSTGLLNAATKPVILVIGDKKAQAYFRMFHLANLGGISYDDAILVDGGEYADGFSGKDLKKFDAIIMDGYKYKDKKSAWKNLDEYIKSGGSLFINTGWQYMSADWEGDKLPGFFPLDKLEWTNAGKTADFKLTDKNLTNNLKSKEISPLVYGDTLWGISSGNKSGLRSWAKPVLSAGDKPIIIAGDYGRGRVVWTGLDLAGHIGTYEDNPSEVKLFNNLIRYLLEGKPNQEVKASFSRLYPDKVEFTFDQGSAEKTAVYWKEAYYPDFKAKLVTNGKSQSIPVYKAGPGMVMFILPNVSQGSKIIYEYKTPFVVTISRIISLLTLFSIVALIVKPGLRNRIVKIFTDKIGKIEIKKKISRSYKDEDMDY